jgi:hypothetical protein
MLRPLPISGSTSKHCESGAGFPVSSRDEIMRPQQQQQEFRKSRKYCDNSSYQRTSSSALGSYLASLLAHFVFSVKSTNELTLSYSSFCAFCQVNQ